MLLPIFSVLGLQSLTSTLFTDVACGGRKLGAARAALRTPGFDSGSPPGNLWIVTPELMMLLKTVNHGTHFLIVANAG